MNWQRALGLVAMSGLVWSGTLAASRYFGILGIVGAIAGVGLPALLFGQLAGRRRLPQPLAWPLLGYCLGSGIATSILMGSGEAPARYAVVALAHSASLTTAIPAVGGGFVFVWMNLFWLVVVGLIASYGVETVKPAAATREEKG